MKPTKKTTSIRLTNEQRKLIDELGGSTVVIRALLVLCQEDEDFRKKLTTLIKLIEVL